MRLLNVWFRRLAEFSHKRRREAELAEELESHLQLHMEDNLRSGMTPEAARRHALITLGGVEQTKEQYRDQRGIPFLETLLQDLRYALHTLLRSPGFTLTAILTLALGIGVNTSIFSLVYSLALRPLPVKDATSIVNVYENVRASKSLPRGVVGAPSYLSYPEYANLRDRNHVFEGLAAYAHVSLSLGGPEAESLSGLLASCNYFDVLGLDHAAGRSFAEDDCHTSGAGPVAILSYGFWQKHFGGDISAIGKRITLNRAVFTIIGVTGRDFGGTELQVPAVWIPLPMAPQLMPNEFGTNDWLALRDVSWLAVVGRVNPGISHRRVEAELTLLARQMDAGDPRRQTTVIVNAGSFFNSPEARSVGTWFTAGLFVVAGLVLLIACINVTNLLLTRAVARQQEVGIRLALGATRPRLVRQLFTESILLALLGGATGILVALWLPPVLVHALPEIPSGRLSLDVTPNFAILGYAILASLAAAVMAGLTPSLHAAKLDIVPIMKEEGSFTGSRRDRLGLQNLIVVAQVAGCTLLLITASLLVRSLHRAKTLNPGFFTKNVYVVLLDLAQKGYDNTRADAFQRALHDRVAAMPGIAGIARSAIMPCSTGYMTSVALPGYASESSGTMVWANIVSPDYFQTMGISILRGRTFTQQEADIPGTSPAVISLAMASRFWPRGDALDKEFRDSKMLYRVVGIAPDVQNEHLGQVDGPFFYGAAGPYDVTDAVILIRTYGNSSATIASIPGIVHQLDPGVMVSTVPFEQSLQKIMEPMRTAAILLGLLGGLAMTLAIVGVSGLVTYAASQRVREIGVRMALGARRRDIYTLLLRRGAKLVAIGLVMGLAFAAAAAVLLSAADILFGLSPLDPLAYTETAALLAVVAFLSLFIPAWRASRVDPMAALRCE